MKSTPSLSLLVKLAESENCPLAIRYEPGFEKYVTPASIKKCVAASAPITMSQGTAKMICMTSWGAHQIMGENLFVDGLKMHINAYVQDLDAQEMFFQRYCSRKGILYPIETLLNTKSLRENFARRYNGSVLYANRLMMIARREGWTK